MNAPHEQPAPGKAADFAAALTAQLPVIRTDRLVLRPPVLADFPLWAEILCGPEGRYLNGPFSRDEAFTEFAATTALWLLRGHGPWVVETHEGNGLGFVLIGFEPGDPEPELGYFFREGARGRGYALEATTAAREHGFGTLDLPGLVSIIHPDNSRSILLARRLGARRDGTIDGSEIWRHERPGP